MNMQSHHKVCIVHGYTANCDAQWFPWLKAQLETQGVSVVVPDMPDSNNPHLSAWIKQLENSIPDLDENTILVGHSLGCVTVLRYLLKKGIRICGIVLVSGFIGQNPMSIQTEGLSEFVQGELDFKKINHLAPKRYVITASDDDIVPSCSTQEMAKTLDAQLIVLDSGKHFIERDGYMSFPVLLNILQQMVEL